MEQVRSFDTAKGGAVKNFCLANVCKGYSIPNYYASAWEAWQHTQQHTDQPPAGLDVPVFFSYTATIDGITKNWGHIGVRLRDGRFWSDGTIYSSIGAYERNHYPRYVGWGESINNVTILKGGSMGIPDTDNWYARMNKLMHQIRNRANGVNGGFTRDEFRKNFVGTDPFRMVEIISDSSEADRATYMQVEVNRGDVDNILRELWGREPNPEDYGYTNMNWKEFIYNALAAYPWNDRKKAFAKAVEENTTLKKQVEDLTKQLQSSGGGISAEDSAAIKETNSIVKAIKDLLSRVFK